jgi:protein-arginine deiminase
MRAAPVLTHTHLQRAQQVLVTRSTRNPEPSKKFVADLRAASTAAGLTEPVFEFTEHGDDEWAQDFLEPMYVNMPVGRSVQSMRVLFRSHQASRDAGEELYRLRGPGVGVVQLAGDSDTQDPMGTLDSMGNLETIPPYSHNGHNYPAGRVIMGHNAGKGYEPSTAVRTFLTSQGMQSPIFIDTSWTIVSHVDEFVQFLPANTPRGWRMAVADPDGAMKVLRDAKATGHGDVRLSSDPGSASKRTIGDYLDSKKATLARINTWAATNIAKTVAALKQEIGLRDDEIIRVPVLFSSAELTFEDDDPAPTTPQLAPGKQTPPSKLATPGDSVMPDKKVTRDNGAASGTQLAARPGAAPQDEPYDYPLFTRLPAAINGVVLAPRRYVAARQWGPVIGRVDIFEKAVTAAYRRAGMSVTFIDDRFLAGGDVHCGTNTLRETTARWWV